MGPAIMFSRAPLWLSTGLELHNADHSGLNRTHDHVDTLGYAGWTVSVTEDRSRGETRNSAYKPYRTSSIRDVPR